MSINKAYEQYKKIDLQTTPQTKIVVVLYDGAIRFLENAIASLDKKHGTEEAHKNILKTQEIVCELLVSLNRDAGDIAERLAAIYTYMNQKLAEGNISKKKPPLLEVLRYLKELRAAWDIAEANYTKQQAAQNSTTNTNATVAKKEETKNEAQTNTQVNTKADDTNKTVDNKLKKYAAGKATDSTSSGKLNISG